MRKGYKPAPDPPAARPRSDSFVRMLELEKMYKMRRLRHDNVSSTLTNNQPRANSPPAVANPPGPRSRRASDYPPLSNQPQIMKANRRGALPSLSVSIPPSPTQALSMGSEGSVRDISPARGEHGKTVTFSEPEDQDLSDHSSICQSPSWEKWGQKKKKKPKKGDNQKSTEKEDTALKRKSNRLVKPAPIDTAAPRTLTTSDRPSSAIELGTSTQSDRIGLSVLTADGRPTTGAPRTLSNELGPGTNGSRPKSRGFLSGFRSEHGNAHGMRGLMGARKSAGKGADESRPVSSIQDDTTPMHLSNTVRPGMDKYVRRSKKPPSIKSMVSGSEQSLSSQEKRGSGTRTSSSSGHGRSQSLLSSTLNKLRGSSMFYYHPSGDSSAIKSSNRADNSQGSSAAHNEGLETPNEGAGKTPGEKSLSHLEARQSFDFAFSSVPHKINMEPGPDIAPRGRQPRPRKVETTSPNVEQDDTGSRPSGNRRVQMDSGTNPTQDTVTIPVAAQENQPQIARSTAQIRPNIANGNNLVLNPTSHQTGGADSGTKSSVSQNQRDEAYRSGNTHALAVNASGAEKLHENKGEAAPGVSRNDKLHTNDRHALEDDRLSVGTYASTIRPTSRHHDGLPKGRRHQNLPGANISEVNVQSTVSERLDVRSKTAAQKSTEDLISFEKEMPDRLQQPLQPLRDADYFSFFSDAYVPPVLDLQSPNDGISARSARFPLPDESDEDGGPGTPNDRFRNDRTKQTPIANDGARRVAKVNDPYSKGVSRTPNGQKQKDSPAISVQYSDSDVPTFERLGLPSKVVKVSGGAEMVMTSAQSQQIDPSRATSERSSSSTYDESPPSPSSLTTPDSSRPQSRKGPIVSNPEASQTGPSENVPPGGSRPSRKIFQGLSGNRSEETMSRNRRAGADTTSGSRLAHTVLGLEQYPDPPFARAGVSTASPSPGNTPTSGSFADVPTPDSEETNEQDIDQQPAPPLSLRAQSAVDLNSASKFLPRALRPQRLQLRPSAEASSVSLPGSSPSGSTEDVMARKPALKTPKNNNANGSEPLTSTSMGAAYLQEARKAAPLATASSSRALRPSYGHKNPSASAKSVVSTGGRAEPLAKMLVECCNCHFFHDMPSRVYECMAKPDSIVEDKSLGVSASISTMVRCPWCAHGMSTQCCAGYAAVVYLQEKLHGK
ncbi:hypothetical protein F4861DRAFT_551409 [Xylaria intraflava]|nr:hypothetical protein F4861DRAFT_551409 [Xylaria intraflava]